MPFMRKTTCLAILACCLIAVLSVSHIPSSGQTPACGRQPTVEDLLNRSINLHQTNGTLILAIDTLAGDHGVPIGIESSLFDKNDFDLTINVDNAKLKDVLDMIVQQQPDYRWEERDGVINLMPVKSRDEFVEELLNTQIHYFAPQKGLDQFGIRDAIIDLPEVQRLLKAKGVKALRIAYYYHPRPYPDDLDLSMSETDVRGVLNKVVRETEYKTWGVTRSGDHLEFLNMVF